MRWSTVAGLSVLCAGVLPTAAGSVVPGRNGRIVFSRVSGGQSTPRELWAMDADGKNSVRLTSRPAANDSAPAFSPDGSRIVFLRIASPTGLFLVPAAGGKAARLTRSPALDGNPAWSPDGTWLAFDRGARRHHVYLLRADSRGLRKLTDDTREECCPEWSPDGKLITYVRDVSIYLVRPDGGGRHRIGRGFDPSWSPDGKRISFWRGDRKLYTMNADGSHVTRLHGDRVDERDPVWSPDGKRLIFARERFAGGAGHGQIWESNPDGTGAVRLTRIHDDGDPTWGRR